MSPTRREALARFWGLVAGSPLLSAQVPYAPRRKPPLAEILNTAEMRDAAAFSLSPAEFERIRAGAGSERTLRRNREFFNRINFRPRMLVNVQGLSLETEILGRKMFAPILAGPTARHQRAHPDAEIATASGCSAAEAWLAASERSSKPWDEIAAAVDQTWWAQLSPSGDGGALRSRAQEAAAADAHAVILTIDGSSRRTETAARSGQATGAHAVPRPRPDATAAIEVIRSAGLPVLVKGVVSASAADAVLKAGAGGVIVSNHGGRSVDGAPATIEALPRIADAVAGRGPLLIDGGFRRGSDILKALSLGADGVLLGRPVLWALAAYGADGVQRLLELMQSELALAMGLSGTRTVADAGPDLVKIRRW